MKPIHELAAPRIGAKILVASAKPHALQLCGLAMPPSMDLYMQIVYGFLNSAKNYDVETTLVHLPLFSAYILHGQ